jgi:hypothetical protein
VVRVKWFSRLDEISKEANKPDVKVRDCGDIKTLFGCCEETARSIMIAVGRTTSDGGFRVEREPLLHFLAQFQVLLYPGQDPNQHRKAIVQAEYLYRELRAKGEEATQNEVWESFPGRLDWELDGQLQQVQLRTGQSRQMVLREAILSWLERPRMVPGDGVTEDSTIVGTSRNRDQPAIEPRCEILGASELQTESIAPSLQKMMPVSFSRLEDVDHELTEATQELETKFTRLSNSKARYPAIDVEMLADWFSQETAIKLDPKQVVTIRILLDTRVCLLPDRVGSGTSTLVSALVGFLRINHVNCLLCTPNEESISAFERAVELNPQTVDRLLKIEPSERFLCAKDQWQDCGLLVVAGAFSIDTQLLLELLRDLPETFALLLIGDPNRSVGPRNTLEYLFGSRGPAPEPAPMAGPSQG